MPFESVEHGNEAGVWVSGALTTFRVWAPRARTVAVVTEAPGIPERFDMRADDGGWFVVTAPLGPGARYRYLLDDNRSYPDPASRYQPEGPHGPSEVVDASRFMWTDEAWTGRPCLIWPYTSCTLAPSPPREPGRLHSNVCRNCTRSASASSS